MNQHRWKCTSDPNKTWGREEEEGEPTTNTAMGGTGGGEKGGGDITRALVVTTLTLNKGVATVDKDAAIKPVEVADASTLAVEVTS